MYAKGKVSVLNKKTHIDLGVDVGKLEPRSHRPVLVQCLRCGEIVKREYRNKDKLHNCPSHIIEGDEKKKWCSGCKCFLPYSWFNPCVHELDSLSICCRACTEKENTKWIKKALNRKKKFAYNNGIEFDDSINVDFLNKLWKRQKGRCLFSQVELTSNKKSLYSANLNRIDQNKGYSKNNICWSCKGFDKLKDESSLQDLVQFLNDVHYKHLAPIRLECRHVHPDGKLPYRKRNTDAGYDLYAIEDCIIPAHGMLDVGTGIVVAAPPGTYITVEGRSGMARKGVMPFRGIIDATYCGEMKVALMNISDDDYEVKKHDRIAQIILHEQVHADFVVVDDFGPNYNQRGTSGFGDSGR